MDVTPEEQRKALELVQKYAKGKGSAFLVGVEERTGDGLKLDWILLNLRSPDLLAICESIIRVVAEDLGTPPAQLAFRLMLHCSEEKR
jgi:hypothetical protein